MTKAQDFEGVFTKRRRISGIRVSRKTSVAYVIRRRTLIITPARDPHPSDLPDGSSCGGCAGGRQVAAPASRSPNEPGLIGRRPCPRSVPCRRLLRDETRSLSPGPKRRKPPTATCRWPACHSTSNVARPSTADGSPECQVSSSARRSNLRAVEHPLPPETETGLIRSVAPGVSIRIRGRQVRR